MWRPYFRSMKIHICLIPKSVLVLSRRWCSNSYVVNICCSKSWIWRRSLLWWLIHSIVCSSLNILRTSRNNEILEASLYLFTTQSYIFISRIYKERRNYCNRIQLTKDYFQFSPCFMTTKVRKGRYPVSVLSVVCLLCRWNHFDYLMRHNNITFIPTTPKTYQIFADEFRQPRWHYLGNAKMLKVSLCQHGRRNSLANIFCVSMLWR
mgnify:CR=1 FL=1